jgi:prepilin-type N-terminal cleavage/methylation domain-containing protein
MMTANANNTMLVRAREEGGFTIVEMLVAMAVLLIGIVATFGVFASSKNANLVAQRHEVAVHQAQREMERLRAFKYGELGLTTPPPTGQTNPDHPDYRVQAGTPLMFRAKSTGCGPGGGQPCDEELVSGGMIEPGPTTFYAGETGAAVSGKIYRYITWRDENCAACTGTQNTKRLFVAVTIDPVPDRPGIGPRKPVWLSSIAIDPNDGPAGGGGGAPSGPPTSAQSFYLYDKTCSDDDANNGYSAPPVPGHSATNDTAAPGTSCDNLVASKRPDLMGPAVPNYENPPNPPWNFSNDLPNPPPDNPSATYPAGLALIHSGAPSSCPATAYELDSGPNPDGDTSTPGKWQAHAWSTRKFTQDFSLSGTAFISLWATSIGSSAGAGRFCATLVDRQVIAGVPNDIVVGSMSRTYTPWPTTKRDPTRSCGGADFPCGRQLTFQFTLSGTKVRADARLMLVVTVLGTSDKDIVLLYDDPRYRSLLQVETTTPCNVDGNPCRNT